MTRQSSLALGLAIAAIGILGQPNVAHAVARITLTEYSVTDQPFEITRGPDGNMWYTDSDRSLIGRLTAGGHLRTFVTLTTPSDPLGITSGPDGNLWFTEALANQIGRITTAGVITEFPLQSVDSYPRAITTGPDGNLWFTELFGNQIGKITPDGDVTEFRIPTRDSLPIGIASAPDGQLWFAESGGDRVGKITVDGTITELPLPAGRAPTDVTLGPNGSMWIAEPGQCCLGGYLAMVSLDGRLTEFAVSGDPTYLIGFHRELWFTEPNTLKVGRMSVDGSVSLYPVPLHGRNNAIGLAPGPRSTLWFCEAAGFVGVISFG